MNELLIIQNIKMLMKAAGDNHRSLAEKSGISQPTISRILNRIHSNPRLTTIQKIAAVYFVKTSQLIGDLPLDFGDGKPVHIFTATDENKIKAFKILEEADSEEVATIMKISKDINKIYSIKNIPIGAGSREQGAGVATSGYKPGKSRDDK